MRDWTKQNSPSPLVWEGCGALASGSELRRSWMGGSAAAAPRARGSAILRGQSAASPPIPTFPQEGKGLIVRLRGLVHCTCECFRRGGAAMTDAHAVFQRTPLSPRGRGMRRLSERSELSRSWVRGRAAGAQRASAVASQHDMVFVALSRARVPVGTQPLIQLRLRGRMSACADGGSAAPCQGSVFFSRQGRRGALRRARR